MIQTLTFALRLARKLPDNAPLIEELRKDKTVRKTLDAYDHLIGLARDRKTTSLADLGALLKLPHGSAQNAAQIVAQANNLKTLTAILAAITAYDFEEARPLLTALVLRRPGQRPPPSFFVAADELGVLASYDNDDDFLRDETERVYRAWAA